jgi:16S rRNA U516 pseudouridylate synthase RsuA-like enzyme
MSTSTDTAVATRTVLDRLTQSGIAEDRALHHLAEGWVRVDGAVVTDPAHTADPPAHVEIRIMGPLADLENEIS